MALLRTMATNLMLTRAVAASWPALKTAATRSNIGRAGAGAGPDEAGIHEFSRLVVENYAKQMKLARAARQAGVGFAGASAITLAGYGIQRLTRSSDQ